MMVWLVRFLRGYLLLEFRGVYSEKILTDIAAAKLSIWGLKYKRGTIHGKIFAKDFKRLRAIRRGTGIKIKISEKHGLPFIIRRYKNRSGLLIGAVMFIIILEFLSSYIWIINIDGNKTVPSSDIIATLKDIGVYEQMPADALQSKIMAQNLLIRRNDLAWASLNLEGCVLNVNVTEIKKAPDSGEKHPANLIALKDGIIRKIDAVSGDVRVKIGDNVHKGDLLISGIIENMSSTVFVHASGIVSAQVEENYKARADFKQEIKKKSGRESAKRVLRILGVKLPLFLAKAEGGADVTYKYSQVKIMGNKVPVRLYTAEYRYYDIITLYMSEEQLKNQLSKQLKEFLQNEKADGYIPLSTDYKKDDGGVTLIHRYLCERNIACEKEILLSQKIDKEE